MTTTSNLAALLRNDITDFVVPLQTTGTVDVSIAERLVRHASALAVALKGDEHLPRSVLNEIYVTAQIIRREADHCKAPGLVELAGKLEMVFALILRGECLEDRQPGVPRVM
ncbi:MAG: hypothetical protein ACI8PZ_004265 [Myxococcota bacterium]|jgi:hypothetical protein